MTPVTSNSFNSNKIDSSNQKNPSSSAPIEQKVGNVASEKIKKLEESSFFNQSFQDQMQRAVEADDHKLVQVLLGSKFCQLWQYWLPHAVVSYNLLAIERDMENLLLETLRSQREIVIQGLEFLNNRKKALEDEEAVFPLEREEARLVEMECLIPELLKKGAQLAGAYKKRIKEQNLPGANFLYLSCDDGEESCQENLDAIAAKEPRLNLDRSSHRAPKKKSPAVVISDRAPLDYIDHALRNVKAVIETNYIEACKLLINEINEINVNDLNGQVGSWTKSLAYLNLMDTYINGDNGRLLDDIMEQLPRDSRVFRWSKTFFRLSRVITTVASYVSNGTLELGSIASVESKIGEIQRLFDYLEKTISEYESIKGDLLKARNIVKEKVIDRMTNSELFDKEFVRIMHEKLLDYYLEKAKRDQKNVLHSDIKNDGVSETKRKILNQAKYINFRQIQSILENAIGNGKTSIDVIKILLVNMAHHLHLYNILMERTEDERVKNLLEGSNNTLMIDVHNSLFDFEDELVDLVSTFPNKKGHFGRKSRGDKILLKNLGKQKYHTLLKGIEDIRKELADKQEIFKTKENRGSSWFNLCYLISDFIWKGLSESQSSIIYEKEEELHRRILCAIHFKDEGIMYDYRKKMLNQGLQNQDAQVKQYIDNLYKMSNKNWERPTGVYTFQSFVQSIHETIEKEEKRKKLETQRKAQESDKKAQESDKKAQESERKCQAMKSCYKELKKLDHELRGGIDEESEDKMIERAAGCGFPEEAMKSIIDVVKAYREEIIKEKRVSDAMIEEGVSPFLAQNASVSGVKI